MPIEKIAKEMSGLRSQVKSFDDFFEYCMIYLDRKGLYPGVRKDSNFCSWLQSKRSLCENSNSYFFDPKLWYRCYKIRQTIKDDNDFLVVYLGRPGRGKSTLMLQMAAIMNPEVTLKYICYDFDDLSQALPDKKKLDTFLLDEGALILNAMERTKDAQALDKLSAIMRQFNLFIGVCLIDFLQLRRHFRDARINNMIIVEQRGRYRYLFEDGVQFIRTESKSNNSNILTMKLPKNTYFEGNFQKEIPIINDINRDSYLEHKTRNAQEFVDDIIGKGKDNMQERKNIIETTGNLYTVKQVAKMMNIKVPTIHAHIKAGKLKGFKYNLQHRIREEDLKEYIASQSRGSLHG
jgi:excisionase family DNA binding protein